MPGAMFSTVTSAFFSISLTISSPFGDFRLIAIDFLLTLNWWKYHGIVIGLAGAQPAAGIAASRVLDLDHLGAEPGQHLGAGRARLELGEIDDLDALQKIEVLGVVAHRSPPVAHKCLDTACAFPRPTATPSRRARHGAEPLRLPA